VLIAGYAFIQNLRGHYGADATAKRVAAAFADLAGEI
jgi:hypothetical protein